jgi:hypothetical protein
MRHQADDVARLVADAGDVVERAVRVRCSVVSPNALRSGTRRVRPFELGERLGGA